MFGGEKSRRAARLARNLCIAIGKRSARHADGACAVRASPTKVRQGTSLSAGIQRPPAAHQGEGATASGGPPPPLGRFPCARRLRSSSPPAKAFRTPRRGTFIVVKK